MNPELLSILRCPEDRSPLTLIDDALLAKLNRAITAETLRNRGGRTVEGILDGGLIRQGGDLVYPIRNHIPVLLRDDAIPLDQL